jgi:uncharacterized protein
MILELPVIQKQVRRNEETDYRFRAYLKERLSLSNAELDTIVQEMTTDVWGKINCLDCGNCCKTLEIVVDKGDILRLAKRLSISTAQFTEKYVTNTDGVSHFMPSCPFLGEDNACSVYEDRPRACRDFPYLYERKFRDYSLTMVENLGTCPIVFNVWEELKVRFPEGAKPPKLSKKKKR